MVRLEIGGFTGDGGTETNYPSKFRTDPFSSTSSASRSAAQASLTSARLFRFWMLVITSGRDRSENLRGVGQNLVVDCSTDVVRYPLYFALWTE